jgi:sortase A
MTVAVRLHKFDVVGSLLKWAGRLLVLAGISILAYCAYVLVETWQWQKQEARLLSGQPEIAPTRLPAEAPVPVVVPEGGLIGRVEIPRLDLSTIVLEGSQQSVLRHAAGHLIGTPLPGQTGNTAIAAHRDTLFRPLRRIRNGDLIRVTTLAGEFDYRVESTRIVNPEDVSVLASSGEEVLTLVTCYPFYYVGPAPKRFIVRAERILRTAPF